MKIFKYPLRLAHLQEVAIPTGATVLAVQAQRGAPCLWALLPDAGPETQALRVFKIVGTGHDEVAKGDVYVGTVQLDDFVWHVFEVPESPTRYAFVTSR